MPTSEFQHYDGCKNRDPDNCSGCALTDERQESPNYAAWPLAYMENNRTIPAKWREAFKRELKSSNKPYAYNVCRTMERLGVRFSDGKELDNDVFKVGTRVFHIFRDEKATVVARTKNTPPEATPVVYDGEESVWNTLTVKLRKIEETK